MARAFALLFVLVTRAWGGAYQIELLNPRFYSPSIKCPPHDTRVWLPGRHYRSRSLCEATRQRVLARIAALHTDEPGHERWTRCVPVGYRDPAPRPGITEQVSPPLRHHKREFVR